VTLTGLFMPMFGYFLGILTHKVGQTVRLVWFWHPIGFISWSVHCVQDYESPSAEVSSCIWCVLLELIDICMKWFTRSLLILLLHNQLSYASMILAVIILSVCPSVTHVLCD